MQEELISLASLELKHSPVASQKPKGVVYFYYPTSKEAQGNLNFNKKYLSLKGYFESKNLEVIRLELNENSDIINKDKIKRDESEIKPIVIPFFHGGIDGNLNGITGNKVAEHLKIIAEKTGRRDLNFIPLTCNSNSFVVTSISNYPERESKLEEIKNRFLINEINENGLDSIEIKSSIKSLKRQLVKETETEKIEELNEKLNHFKKIMQDICEYNNLKSEVEEIDKILDDNNKKSTNIDGKISFLETIIKYNNDCYIYSSEEYKDFLNIFAPHIKHSKTSIICRTYINYKNEISSLNKILEQEELQSLIIETRKEKIKIEEKIKTETEGFKNTYDKIKQNLDSINQNLTTNIENYNNAIYQSSNNNESLSTYKNNITEQINQLKNIFREYPEEEQTEINKKIIEIKNEIKPKIESNEKIEDNLACNLNYNFNYLNRTITIKTIEDYINKNYKEIYNYRIVTSIIEEQKIELSLQEAYVNSSLYSEDENKNKENIKYLDILDNLKSMKAFKKEEKPNLEKKIKELEEEKESLEEEKESLEEEKEFLEKRKKSLEEEKESLEEEKEFLEKRKKSLEEEKEFLEKRKKSLKEKKELLEKGIEELEEEKNKLQEEVESEEIESEEVLIKNSKGEIIIKGVNINKLVKKLENEKTKLEDIIKHIKERTDKKKKILLILRRILKNKIFDIENEKKEKTKEMNDLEEQTKEFLLKNSTYEDIRELYKYNFENNCSLDSISEAIDTLSIISFKEPIYIPVSEEGLPFISVNDESHSYDPKKSYKIYTCNFSPAPYEFLKTNFNSCNKDLNDTINQQNQEMLKEMINELTNKKNSGIRVVTEI